MTSQIQRTYKESIEHSAQALNNRHSSQQSMRTFSTVGHILGFTESLNKHRKIRIAYSIRPQWNKARYHQHCKLQMVRRALKHTENKHTLLGDYQVTEEIEIKNEMKFLESRKIQNTKNLSDTLETIFKKSLGVGIHTFNPSTQRQR